MKFNRHNITDGTNKARVFYSLDNRIDGRKCVTIYAKDWDNNLQALIPSAYKNDSDSMTDYFEKGKAVLFEDHPLYTQAREVAERFGK
jgi:hypothetical protein